jgi:hypothetical protein
MDEPWTLVIDGVLFDELTTHLFRDDDDEHGAVIAAGVAKTDRGTRLLARELFLARTASTSSRVSAATGC